MYVHALQMYGYPHTETEPFCPVTTQLSVGSAQRAWCRIQVESTACIHSSIRTNELVWAIVAQPEPELLIMSVVQYTD